MRALVFPGQGSQAVGMGREIYDTFPEAREVFEEVSEALSRDFKKIIFEGPESDLNSTENTQPAMMLVSLATMRVLEKQSSGRIWDNVACVAGHSLGEYSALTAAGTFGLPDTAKLLKVRGESMQGAVEVGTGGCVAILGLEFDTVEQIANQASSATICVIANDNAPGQIVISGHNEALEKAISFATEQGAKRSLRLPVSVPVHSPLMQPAANAMQQALAAVEAFAPKVPLFTNVTASLETDPEMIKSNLVEQVTGRVRWRESIEKMSDSGIVEFIEIGAGKVLSGLNKRIAQDSSNISINTPEDIEAILS